jgi:hypothetical protein
MIDSKIIVNKPVNVSRLSKSSMKKLIRFVIRANKKIKGITPVIKTSSHKDNPHTLNIEEEIAKIKEKLKRRVEMNKPLQEKKKQEFFEKKKIEKELGVIIPEPVKVVVSDPKVNEKKKKILEIKTVLEDLERKHRVFNDSKEHDPVLIRNIEEKISLLKKRISIIENE